VHAGDESLACASIESQQKGDESLACASIDKDFISLNDEGEADSTSMKEVNIKNMEVVLSSVNALNALNQSIEGSGHGTTKIQDEFMRLTVSALYVENQVYMYVQSVYIHHVFIMTIIMFKKQYRY
jgi:hypothetical protein